MQSKESDINEIMEQIVQFSEDRDWDQFHKLLLFLLKPLS